MKNVNLLLLFLGVTFVVAAMSILFPGFYTTFTVAGSKLFPWFLVLSGLGLIVYARSMRARAAPALAFGFILTVGGMAAAGYDVLSVLASSPKFVGLLTSLIGLGMIVWGISKFSSFGIVKIIGGLIAIGVGLSMTGVSTAGMQAVGAFFQAIFGNIMLWIFVLLLVLLGGIMKLKGVI